MLNTCARAVRYATTGPDNASRQADCSAFLAVTVTPAAEWVFPFPFPSFLPTSAPARTFWICSLTP